MHLSEKKNNVKVIQQTENKRPLLNEKVRVKHCGNVTEIKYQTVKARGGSIMKVSKTEYIDLRTGELKQFNTGNNKSDTLSSVARSLSKGRDMLNANIDDVTKCRWLTLTYAQNMTDNKKLYDDFKNFNKRLKEQIGQYEYIVAVEPQARGAWHIHAVLIFEEKAPYIENKVISDAWKQGFVTVKKLDDVDNVGAYLSAYLGDIEMTDDTRNIQGQAIKEVEITDDTGNKETKRYIKGGRLHMYPLNMRIFRWSKGCKKPKIEDMTEEKAQKKVSSAKLTFEKTVTIKDTKTGFENNINYRYYNTKINEKSQ